MIHQNKCRVAVLFVAIAFLTAPCALAAAVLRAGAAKEVITPDVHAGKVYMAGFGFNRVATGVHDDLYARCLALNAGGQTVAICGVDLIGLFYPDVLKVRAEVKARAPEITHLIIGSSHDHEGPDTLGIWGPRVFVTGVNQKYLDWVEERIADAAAQAARNMRDATLTLARNDSPLLSLLQDDSRPPYVKDPYLFVMRLAAAGTNKPIATLVNWSDHAETLDSKNTLITADYPHWLCEYVEGHGGGTAVFINGSIGGLLSTLGSQVALLNPETGKVAKDGTWEKAQLVGTMLGESAVRTVDENGQKVNVESLVIRKKVILIPLANQLFRFDAGMGGFGESRPLYTNGKPDPTTVEKPISDLQSLMESLMGKKVPAAVLEQQLGGLKTFKYATGQDMQTEVDYLEFLSGGRVVAEILTVPGEIYPELVNGGITRYPGADYPNAPFEPTLRSHLKSRYQFIFGLANDEIGYMIPKAEWDNQPPWLLHKPERWYGEVNSAGPDVAGTVTRALVSLIQEK
jgi:hypothetical protein